METLAEYRNPGKVRAIDTRADSRKVLSLPDAIRACRKGRLTQDDLSSKTSIGQSTLSQWELGKSTPDALQMHAIEMACERPAGWISVQAGLVHDVRTVPDAIAMDPELDDIARKALLDAYKGAKRKL